MIIPGEPEPLVDLDEPQDPQKPPQPQNPTPPSAVAPVFPIAPPAAQEPKPRFPVVNVDVVQARELRRNRAISAAFTRALELKPEQAAEAQQIARALGRPDDFESVAKDIDVQRAFLQQRQLADDKFAKAFPFLAKKMEDVKFVALARDDLGNLQLTEKAWGEYRNAWDSAMNTSRLGTMGTMALLEEREFTPDEKRRRRIMADQERAYRDREPGWIASGINLAGSLMETLATGAVAGAAAAPTGPAAPVIAGVAMFGQSWRLEVGNLYGSLIEQGYTPREAQEIAYTYGTAIASVDLIGAKVAGKALRGTIGDLMPRLFARGLTQETRMRALGDAAKDYLKTIVVEPVTEGIQEAIGMAGEDELRARLRPNDPSVFNYQQIADVWWDTFRGSVVLGGVGGTASTIAGMRRAADAEHTAKQFESLAEIEEKSKLGERDPQARADFVQQNAHAAGQGTMHVRADKLLDTLERFQQGEPAGRTFTGARFEQLFPGLTDEARAAAARGGNVTVRTGDFMAKLGRTPFGRELMQHSTFKQDGDTPHEAKQAKELAKESGLVKKAEEAIKAAGEEAQQWTDEGEQVRSAVFNMRRAAGAVHEQALLDSTLTRAAVIVNARRSGMTPLQYWKEQGFDVLTGATGTRTDIFPMFAGQNAATADKSSLAVAELMEQQGVPDEEIRQKTGWQRGTEGKWKFEVSDKEAKLLSRPQPGGAWLETLLQHPKLFAAYPGLAYVTTSSFTRSKERPERGLAKPMSSRAEIADDLGDEETLSVLLHEIQHHIQFREKFATGGTPSEFDDERLREIVVNDARNRFAKIRREHPEAVDLFEAKVDADFALGAIERGFADVEVLSPEQDHAHKVASDKAWAATRAMKEDPFARELEDLQRIIDAPNEALSLAAFSGHGVSRIQAYKRLAGETEARNVQERQHLTEEERQATSPKKTADVSEADQIVRASDLSLGDSFKQQQSTRLPSAVSSTEDPSVEVLTTDLAVMLADKETTAKNVAAIRKLPFMKLPKGTKAADVIEAFITHMANNLDWLFSQMSEADRKRARIWYEGGRKAIDRWADRYGLSAAQTAGVIAVLSPQKDWFANMSMAERMLDMLSSMQKFKWDEKMTARATRIDTKGPRKGMTNIPVPKGWTAEELVKMIEGRTLEQVLPNKLVASYWLRVFDQTHNEGAITQWTPEGGTFGKHYLPVQWTSYATLAKVVSVYKDGSAANVSLQLGDEHKVRSFYNNLFAPDSDRGHTTIDTHAVAAAYLLPVSGTGKMVKQVWGGEGGAGSDVTGLYGFYPIVVEAYKRVAAKHKMLPREVQSITWEQVRTMFSPAQKRNEALVAKATAIWKRYRNDEITQEAAQQEVLQAFGGFTALPWAKEPTNVKMGETYKGLSRTEAAKHADRGRKTGPTNIMVEAQPDADPKRLARWQAMTPDEQVRATKTILDRIVPLVLQKHGANGAVVPLRGAYLGKPAPSIAVIIEDADKAVAVANELGAVLHQKSMMVQSLAPGKGLFRGEAVAIRLPDGYTVEEIDKFYTDVLWPILDDTGRHPATGQSVQEGIAVVSIDPGATSMSAKQLNEVLSAKLDDTFGLSVLPLHLAFPASGTDYGTTDSSRSDSPAQPPAQEGSGGDVQAAADRAFEEVFTESERRREAGGGGLTGKAVALQQTTLGEYSPTLRQILLNPKANASTFAHEMAHWALEEMARIAALGRMQGAEAVHDIRILLDWAGFSGTVQEWRALPISERADVHEKVARSWEIYLFEGKAPSKEIRGVFERLSRLIRQVYRAIVGEINLAYRAQLRAAGKPEEDLPGLTDEVRHVFGRMIASEDAIRSIRDTEQIAGLFQTKAEFVAAGGNPEKWEAMRQAQQDEENAQNDELIRDRLKEVGWQSEARSKALKDLQREHDDTRREVRAEVEQEVDRSPIGRARLWLKTGRLIDETGRETRDDADATHTLRRDAVQAMTPPGMDSEALGGTRTNAEGEIVAVKGSFLTEDGVHPDAVAHSLGYATGEELVHDLLIKAPREELIRVLTDERMLAEHSDLINPERIEEQVRRAVHNDARKRVLARELQALEKSEISERVLLGAAREAARQAMAGRPLNSIGVREFAAAARRARVAAKEALLKGDLLAARQAKRAEMLNDALVSEAADARAEVRAGLKLFGKAFRPDKRLATTRDINMVGVIRAILAAYGLGRGGKSSAEHMKPVEQYDPQTHADLKQVVDDANEAASRLPDGDDRYLHMTLDQFRDLEAQVHLLWQQSRLMRQVTLDGQKQSIDAAVKQARAQLSTLPEQERLGAAGAATPLETVQGWVADYMANLRRVEHLFRRIDGGNNDGIFTRLFRRVKQAGDKYRRDLRNYSKRYETLLKQLDFDVPHKIASNLGRTRDNPGYVFGRGSLHAKAEIIGMALHFLGNASNRDKLVRGRRWAEADVQKFLDDMIDQGVLTEKDFKFIQATYDLNEELKPQLFQAHFDMTGYRPEEVKATPFTNRFGTFAGGYVPAKRDAAVVAAVETNEQDQRAEFMKSIPIVPRGMTKARIEEYARELSLNPLQQATHMAEVLRFVHMAPAVRDVRRVLADREVRDRLERDLGKTVFSSTIDPWLKNSSLQRVGTPPDNSIDKVIDWLRRSANMNVMFLNVSNALQNISGLWSSLREVSPRYVLSALLRVATARRSSMDAIAARSVGMQNRFAEQVFDLRQQMHNMVVKPGMVRRGVKWVTSHTYVLQSFTQNFVDAVTAEAAYQQEYAKQIKAGATEEVAQQKAVNFSDSLVRRTQMAGDPEDVSKFESGSALQRAIFPFKSWFINFLNHNITSAQTSKGMADLVATYVYGVMLPSITAAAINEMIAGRLADDDDDGWGDEAANLWWKSQLDTLLGTVPLVGDWTKSITNTMFDDEVWNDRMPQPPYLQLAEKVRKEFGDWKRDFEKEGRPSDSNLFDALLAIGEFSGLPVRALGSRAKAFAEHPDEPIRTLVTGRAAPTTR